MQPQLRPRTLELVAQYCTRHGDMKRLAEAAQVDYLWLYRFHKGLLSTVDVDRCERLYYFLNKQLAATH